MKKIEKPKKAPKTQEEEVMLHLFQYKSITSWEAIKLYGITRLSEIIRRIRSKDYLIETEDIKFTNRYGNSSAYAKYNYVYIEPLKSENKQLNLLDAISDNRSSDKFSP